MCRQFWARERLISAPSRLLRESLKQRAQIDFAICRLPVRHMFLLLLSYFAPFHHFYYFFGVQTALHQNSDALKILTFKLIYQKCTDTCTQGRNPTLKISYTGTYFKVPIIIMSVASLSSHTYSVPFIMERLQTISL